MLPLFWLQDLHKMAMDLYRVPWEHSQILPLNNLKDVKNARQITSSFFCLFLNLVMRYKMTQIVEAVYYRYRLGIERSGFDLRGGTFCCLLLHAVLYMATGEFSAGGNPAMDQHSIHGG